VEQIVLNLAVNARDAMPKGGQLTISTSVIKTDDDYVRRNPEARIGKFVCLSVSDTGCGMNQATLARIFEPFFTTKELGKGTGLGLATVYGIIKQHQGWIEVESAVEKGTTFKVLLPVSRSAVPREKIPAAPDVRGGTETLLVVEDEPPVRELVGSCLRRYGYHVLEASDGPEALAIWKEHGKEIDLLLTDMVMPGGMTGGELAARLKKENGRLKVIYSSGYNIEMATGELRPDQDASYLAKPYNPTKLAATIRRCLDGKV
jgi:CheY-like chemotaxis protein